MSIIGHFAKTATGYIGMIRTLTLQMEATITEIEQASSNTNAPDYLVFGKHAGDAVSLEIGTGRNKKSSQNNPYLAIKLDDPSFPESVFGALFQSKTDATQYMLVWNRKREQEALAEV